MSSATEKVTGSIPRFGFRDRMAKARESAGLSQAAIAAIIGISRVSAVLPAPWTCHSLRHAFATSLYAACHDWAVVQDALGHASMDTTRRYVLMPDAPAVAAVRSLTLVGGTQIERT